MKKIFLFLFFIQLIGMGFAQMADEQVIHMLQSAGKQGMGQQEILLMLTQRGVTQEQLLRIKNQYEKENGSPDEGGVMTNRMRGENAVQSPYVRSQNSPELYPAAGGLLDSLSMKLAVADRKIQKRPTIFGQNVFNNGLLTFEPNINIATPERYILGPGDEVIVDIWGDSEQNFRQQISPDGTITDSRIGPVYLSGLSVKEANARLKNAFGRIYSTISGENPTTFIRLSLGEIRSIQVNIMGEVVMPGTYTLPSLASLFHAIYNAGGVNGIGSLRDIRIIRRGKEIARVDVYDYLLRGKSEVDIRLEDGDVIIVSPYQNLVNLKGKVKRPMIYEMIGEETIADILNYAGGFTGDAYKNAIRVIRKSGREYQVYNVDQEDFNYFKLTDRDELAVDSVIDRFENRVEIQGAVYRPGLYALGGRLSTVKQLLEKAEGVREDAFMDRAVIYREKANRMPMMMAVDMAALLKGEAADIELQKNDVLYIPSIFDLKEDYTINVYGAVGKPGRYKYAEGMTVEDLIVQAGGLKEAASVVKVEVARRIKNPKSTLTTEALSENYILTLKDGLIVDGKQGFVLEPFDEVYIRRSPGYKEQQNVRIEGEVLFGGEYVLKKKNQRLSDLVRDAGGLTPEAYVSGARLTRQLNEDEKVKVASLLKLSRQSGKDSIDMDKLDLGNTYFVGIDLAKAMANPGSEYDLVLREGDRLYVPEYTGTVKISGAVMYPNTVAYQKNANLKYYIGQGGGFASRAKKRKVFIVYMNGTVARSKVFAKAQATPGCEIIVPVKPLRKGTGLAEMLGIATSTTSIAALITSIINNTK